MHKLAYLILFFVTPMAIASAPSPHHFVDLEIQSKVSSNDSADQKVLYSEEIRVKDATWLRLFFGPGTKLGNSEDAAHAKLRLTSLKDGAQQTLDSESLVKWQNSSAYFNGDAIRVELLVDAGATGAQVQIVKAMVGEPAPKSICGATDDRQLESDPRAARMFPVGCTAWLIDDAHACFLTAGHCLSGGGLQIAQFNVPLSNPDGSINHPGPEDQYPMDPASSQFTDGGVGNDWGYFGTVPNSETGLTAAEVAGSTYVLGTPPATAGGEIIRITGYGTVTGTQGAPQEWSQVQTTHTGLLTSVAGTTLRYAVDTTGGNSGSAVVNESDSGVAIGIHSHAGCNAGGGANQGTNILHPDLQNALANPTGVCATGPALIKLNLTANVGDPVPTSGAGPIEFEVTDLMGDPAIPESATLVYDNGNGEESVDIPVMSRGPTVYSTALPALECGQEVRYRIDVQGDTGPLVRLPSSVDNSAGAQYVRTVGATFDGTFADDMQTDMGWTVDDDPGLTDGTWERAATTTGSRNDPGYDADGSGMAFLTHAEDGNTDVDGGATRLISPAMDATSPEATITYWRWFSVGGTTDDDFLVEVSDDDGASWVELETVATPGDNQWHQVIVRVADVVANTNQFRLRFTASDTGDPSIVEAGVDGVKLYNNFSGLSCDLYFSNGFEQPPA